MSLWQQIFAAWGAMAFLMAALWFVQLRTRNAGIVDVAWSFGTGLCAVWFVYWAPGDPVRRWVIAVIAGLWALRLGGALLRRVSKEAEDGRYRMLRDKWKERTQPLMLGFFQIQAFWAVLFALPMLGAAHNPSAFGLLDYMGVAVWFLALSGESVADMQLARFRENPENKGQVCREGLWAWSRHPNYFFEWLHWFAYVLLAVGSPLAWLTWAGVAVMLLFLTKVTGIPLTEARSLQSRGEAYRDYQREVSPFFPWPPKRRQA